MIEKPKLVPLGEMAERLRVPRSWLKAEADAGRLPHLKAGARVLFDAQVVEALLHERAIQKGAPHGS
jgi:excisionase family DNA binding protein